MSLSPSPAGRLLVPLRAVPKPLQAIQWLVQEWALVGLLAGILVLALTGAQGTWCLADLLPVTHQTTISPRVMMLRAGVSLTMSPSAENYPAVVAHRGSPFWDHLWLDASDLNDDPSSMVGLLARNPVFSPLLSVWRMNGATHAFSWLSRYIVRPQLLTRLSPLR